MKYPFQKYLTRSLIAGLGFFLLSSCMANPPAVVLFDHDYHLVMEDKWESFSPVPHTPFFTLSQDPQAKEQIEVAVSGFAGVNRFVGKALLDRESQTLTGLDHLATSMMAGPEKEMNLETEFLNMLAKVQSYGFQKGKLVLKDAQGNSLGSFLPSPHSEISEKE